MLFAVGSRPLLAGDSPVTLRGKLVQTEGRPSVLAIPGGKTVTLDGDGPTNGVLNDVRLNGMDLEVIGGYSSNGTFRILPIYKKGIFVHKDGKRLLVTYWCAVCSIRTYTPGLCLCCQEYTELDLREKLDN